ncbi:MAG: hypothetical protein H7233_07790 [Pseudorhodobacter sp.]|nr:hypothetical protein [Frankiaceae bacterium]
MRARLDAYSPSSTPSFDVVTARRRLRDRRRAGAAAFEAALAVAMVTLLPSTIGSGSRSRASITPATSAQRAPEPAAGSIRGVLPLCYGPGPDMNLRPDTTVTVTGESGWRARRTFPSSKDQREFHFDDVPPGSYTVVIEDVPRSDRQVQVQPGEAVQAATVVNACL